jgi:predicted nucleic-acid-binding Zn-ribbon protein
VKKLKPKIMPLSAQQQQKLTNHLNLKWTNRNCTCCGNNNWGISPDIIFNPSFDAGNINMGSGKTFVVLTCNNCHHVVLFGAQEIGLI